MNALDRWNDDRLDDFYEEFRRMATLVEELGAIKANLSRVLDDSAKARQSLHDLRDDMASDFVTLRADLVRRDQQLAIERRTSTRWLIGTMVSVTAIMVAAIGIIVSAVG